MHGDDFTTLGKIDDLKWFSEQLRQIWIIEDRGILGPPHSKHMGAFRKCGVSTALFAGRVKASSTSRALGTRSSWFRSLLLPNL